jgi:hypothetical protein
MNHAAQFIKLAQIDKEAFHYKGHYVADNKLYEYHQSNRPMIGYTPTPGTRRIWEQHKELTPDHPEFNETFVRGASNSIDEARANFQRARDKRRNIIIGASAAGVAVASLGVPLMFRGVRNAINESTRNILSKGKFMKKANAVDYVDMLRMEKRATPVVPFGKAMARNPISGLWNMGNHLIGSKQGAEAASVNLLNPALIKKRFEPEIQKLTSHEDLLRRTHERLSQKAQALASVKEKPGFLDRHVFDRNKERINERIFKNEGQLKRTTRRHQQTSSALESKKDEMAKAFDTSSREFSGRKAAFKKYMKKTQFQRKALNVVGRTAVVGAGGAALYGGNQLINIQPQYQPAQY